jgi:hypothetical protein
MHFRKLLIRVIKGGHFRTLPPDWGQFGMPLHNRLEEVVPEGGSDHLGRAGRQGRRQQARKAESLRGATRVQHRLYLDEALLRHGLAHVDLFAHELRDQKVAVLRLRHQVVSNSSVSGGVL